MRSPGLPALAGDSILAGVRRPARADMALLRDGEQRPPYLYRWPWSPARGRRLPTLLRRLDRLLGRPEARDSHQSAHGPFDGTESAGAERADGNGGDLGEGGRPHDQG